MTAAWILDQERRQDLTELRQLTTNGGGNPRPVKPRHKTRRAPQSSKRKLLTYARWFAGCVFCSEAPLVSPAQI